MLLEFDKSILIHNNTIMVEGDTELFAAEYFASVASTGILGILCAASPTENKVFIWNIVDIDNMNAGELGVIGDKMAIAVLRVRMDREFNLHMGYISTLGVQVLEDLCREDGMKLSKMLREHLPEPKPQLRIIR